MRLHAEQSQIVLGYHGLPLSWVTEQAAAEGSFIAQAALDALHCMHAMKLSMGRVTLF